jgi:hypothetical protein
MISALGKSDATSSNANHGADKYRELPSAGSEIDKSTELGQITRTRIIVIEESRKKDDYKETTMAPTW